MPLVTTRDLNFEPADRFPAGTVVEAVDAERQGREFMVGWRALGKFRPNTDKCVLIGGKARRVPADAVRWDPT